MRVLEASPVCCLRVPGKPRIGTLVTRVASASFCQTDPNHSFYVHEIFFVKFVLFRPLWASFLQHCRTFDGAKNRDLFSEITEIRSETTQCKSFCVSQAAPKIKHKFFFILANGHSHSLSFFF